MGFVQSLRPTLWKMLLSVFAIALWWLYRLWIASGVMCARKSQVPLECTGYFSVLPEPCSAGCTTLSHALLNLILLLLPGLLLYLLYSLVQFSRQNCAAESA